MIAPQLKLTYFDIIGRAELARLLFTFGGIAFEDKRISNPEFGALKPTLPLGQVPALEVDGVVYSQSMAIARYAAKLAGLYPQDATQALHVDMVSETLMDLVHAVVDIRLHTSDETLKAEKTKKFREGLPKTFAALEKLVQGKFFTGDHATLADVHLFDIIANGMTPNFPEFPMAAYPKLEGVVAGVKANPNVAAYLAKHHK